MKTVFKLFKFLLKIYTGYYIFNGILLLLRKWGIIYKPIELPVLYVKEIPFPLNPKAIYRLRLFAQFVFTLSTTAILAFIFLNNIAPLGAKAIYVVGDTKNGMEDLGPLQRVRIEKIQGQKVFYQSHDIAYFSTPMPFHYDFATVKIIFQNPNSDQVASIGFQDQKDWHYETKLFDVPLLNTLPWNHNTNSEGQTLYQKTQQFSTVNAFLTNVPKTKLIGTFQYDPIIGEVKDVRIPDYKPSAKPTVISTPLRGKATFFVYLEHEPFSLHILKQDLNWHEDPDVMTVKIYKHNKLVYSVVEPDDGIQDGSGKHHSPQEITIKTSKTFPESGIYKVVIDANADTVIKKITTNLHKIVFQGNIFPIANKEAYSMVAATTSATTVYTNALALSAQTIHNGSKQTLLVDDQQIPLTTLKENKVITPKNTIAKVVIPKSDIILSAYQGYIAFDKKQFFLPTPYHIIPIQTSDDTSYVDYVFANYVPPQKQNDWKVSTQTFHITSAFVENGKLRWIIQAPKLKENNRELIIKDIIVTLSKKSLF